MMAAARVEARLAAEKKTDSAAGASSAPTDATSTTSASSEATSNKVGIKWDASNLPSNILLSADGTTASHSNQSWSTVRSERMVTSEDGDVIEVEFGTPCVDNISLFLGVAEASYFDEAAVAAAEGAELLPRDSKHAICIHGDGRVFIKGKENKWGLMRIATGDPILLTIDFLRGTATYKLTHTVRGQEKATVAEVPGLFRHGVYLFACFGGRHQELSITRCEPKARRAIGGGDRRRAKDVFAEAIGERVAPVPFTAPIVSQTYEQQLADMAATLDR